MGQDAISKPGKIFKYQSGNSQLLAFILEKATGKDFNYKIFDADHAFANPSGDRYLESAAQEANVMALKFLKKRF